ncbi:hypothetical protein KKG65_01840 [Patescibacteria group bacterium]|nr:hypothetical protein [Patescibacteria group bacterium]
MEELVETEAASEIARDKKDILHKYPGLSFLEKLKDVSNVNYEKEEEKVLISFDSTDGYRFKYTLRIPTQKDFVRDPEIFGLDCSNYLIVESCIINYGVKEENLLESFKRQDPNKKNVVYLVDTQAPHLFEIPDSILEENNPVEGYQTRNHYIYSNSEFSKRIQAVFMPIVTTDAGLAVLAHEYGHARTFKDAWLRYKKESDELENSFNPFDVSARHDVERARNLHREKWNNKEERFATAVGLNWWRHFRRKMVLSQKNDSQFKISLYYGLMDNELSREFVKNDETRVIRNPDKYEKMFINIEKKVIAAHHGIYDIKKSK